MTERRVAWEFVADDAYADDVIYTSTRDTWTRKAYSWSFTNLPCNEDIGTDEVFVRVRVEVWEPGYGWRRPSWLTGPSASGSCV
ncbi:MAG: hypothetical protein WAW88_04740 [Nocardioides sp.]